MAGTRDTRSVLAALVLACTCVSCGSDEPTEVTQVIVAITSDLPPGETLTRIEVALSERDGSNVSDLRDYTIVESDPSEGQHSLPLHFSVVKGESDTFLIVVTGYGSLGGSSRETKLVEAKAIVSFQAKRALLLRMFLGRVCVGNFCDGDEEKVCYTTDRLDISAGACGNILHYDLDDLEQVDLDELPDLASLPDGSVIGGDGDGGTDTGDSGPDIEPPDGGDTGCVDPPCPCEIDDDCDDERFCTIDRCLASGECDYTPRVCEMDDNACTLPPVCSESRDACEQPFDESSLSSTERCARNESAPCEVCEGDGTRTPSCVLGRCRLTCEDGRVDADGDEDNGCECEPEEGADLSDDLATDGNCDGADGEIGGNTLYASVAGSGAHDGSSPEDAATLEEAFAILNVVSARELLVASGVYVIDAPLVPPDDLVVLGGYAEDFRSREGSTHVVSSSATALRVIDAESGVVIDSVDIESGDQSEPGASSQAIVVESSSLTLRRLTVIAGNGGNGAAGTVGTQGGGGVEGEEGFAASAGGAGGNSGPGGGGGAGGVCTGDSPGAGGTGLQGGSVSGQSCGNGGAFGAASSPACVIMPFPIAYDGEAGQSGIAGCVGDTGNQGDGGSGFGTIEDGVWSGPLAESGGQGSTGYAGGGGGGGGAVSCYPPCAGGGGGGEGGGGGGGGGGGTPGAPGGASIAIVATDATLDLTLVTLETGRGGQGGRGGNGGEGGEGAAGGRGGQGGSNSTDDFGAFGGNGGPGGQGGSGGRGGCGGGGAGGPSVGIFAGAGGDGVTIVTAPTYEIGSGGNAGAACSQGGGNTGSVGPVADTRGL